MNKGINQVRKSITQRKKTRGMNSKEIYTKNILPSLPQDEEKHGYYPVFSDGGLEKKGKSQIITGFMLKGILSIMLFSGVALLFQTNIPMFLSSKEWTRNMLTEEFPFARVNQWYQETFGAPLAFSPKANDISGAAPVMALPVSGDISESFQANGTGIMITPNETSDVFVLREGVIIFAGNDKETNKTVIVQHADGSESTYGYLSSIDVHLYQLVANNQRLGEFVPTEESKTVYFSIQKDNEYINPVQVIKVDDLS